MQEEIERVCKSVLRMVTPKEREETKIRSLAEKLEEKVVSASKLLGVKTDVRLEGSVAKDTWVSGEPDIDIFLQLPRTLPRKSLGKIGLKIAKKATEDSKQIERFAEHPYLEAIVDDVRVNIVPCYKTRQGKWLSATDRTPFHTDFVREHLDKQMIGEVRLLKKFMKGIGTYGAEIKLGGFSGYLCELLILNYESFLETLRAFAQQEKRIIIDLKNHYNEREDELQLIFKESLVVVDPIDSMRNVASAVKPQRLYTFVAAARAFMKNPNIKFFYPPETTPLTAEHLRKELRNRGSAIIFLMFGKVDAVSDILWGQLYKSQRSLFRQIQLNGFKILRDIPWSDEGNVNMFIFELEQRFISPIKKHIGPPLQKRIACQRFLQKHIDNPGTVSGPYIEDGRWAVEILRTYRDVLELLQSMLKDGGRKIGVAEKISENLLKGFKILVNDEIVEKYGKNIKLAKFLTDFLSGRPKWLENYHNNNNAPRIQQ